MHNSKTFAIDNSDTSDRPAFAWMYTVVFLATTKSESYVTSKALLGAQAAVSSGSTAGHKPSLSRVVFRAVQQSTTPCKAWLNDGNESDGGTR
jgi:hypothetical protein